MKKRQFIIIIVVCLVLTIIHIINSGFYLKNDKSKVANLNNTDTTINYKDKNILPLSMLEKIKKKNPDVYGWVTVDGTKIYYPIAQHKDDDSYYLSHDFEKNNTIYGAVFTQKYNSRNFEDNFTIIYGHAMKDGSMFGDLNLFNNKDFFDKHKYIHINFENMLYTYEIVSAYRVNNEHLFSKYDLTTKEKVKEYYNNIKNVALDNRGYFRNIKLENNKMLTLSTCNSSYDDNRFIVQAVLRKGEKIKQND